ncbi:MAG: hypothetical protein JSW10_00120 [Pseudomonadota bacterium]|nr:MAG: hypothetical protein JSW10_00120 [Pseudomonadota bacterium]
MRKPTTDELEHALARAAAMRAAEDDPDFLAKSLLSLSERVGYLEKVYEAVEHYMHSGQGVREHSQLMRALEAARRGESQAQGQNPRDWGLT